MTDRIGKAPRAIAGVARISLSEHILPTAATMVGVCMTVLSIGRLSSSGRLGVVIDKMLAFDGVVFLVSAVLSFVAIRIATNTDHVETWAERLFLVGLSLCAVVAVVIAFAIDL
ncbi:MAG: hypothetical protein NTX56_19160 [Proteobacteria bacterium]|nr:hypothetical protein [Pseudomonadota bacterium]